MIKLSKKKLIIVLIISFLIVVLQIPQYFFLSLNTAAAANFENDYIDNVSFYYDTTDNLILKFHVKTTFAAWPHEYGYYIVKTDFGASGFMDNATTTIEPNLTDGNFIAGNTYKIKLGTVRATNWPYNQTSYCGTIYLTKEYWNCWSLRNLQHPLNNTNYIKSYGLLRNAVPDDTILAYYDEYPTLTVNYPQNNAEIAGNFNITGTITQPSPYEYNELWTYVYFYNPWQTYHWGWTTVGIFKTPLQATSTQSFTQEIIGLPASETGTFIFINELKKVVNGTSVKQYQGGAEYPWRIEITHLKDEGTLGLPENLPNWQTYLDIYKPKASDDGYFRIKTPTSSVDFIYKFPETYKIKITQEGVEKLATTTFDEIDPYGTGFFTVNNIDAETGTVKWLQATVYNYEDEEVINALFPIVGLEEGELENLGYGATENFLTRFLSSLFVPSTAYLNKFKIDLPELLKIKIPFSYFYDIKTAFNDVQVGEAKEFPKISYAIAGYNFEFNPLDIADLLESEGWATFYDLMKIACWLMFILYLFGRIRDRTTNTAD